MTDDVTPPAQQHGPALVRIRRMAWSMCDQHTDPAWHEPVPVLVHEMNVESFIGWCGDHGVDPLCELVLAAAIATHRCAHNQPDRCAVLNVAHPMTKHLRPSLHSWAVREVRDCVLDIATADPPTPPMSLNIDDDEHTDELATALMAWLAAIGSAHAAISEGTIEASLCHLLPERPML
ncbi:MAG: hypothetical protein WD023_08035 [Ilumatobacteraceae bacterium]